MTEPSGTSPFENSLAPTEPVDAPPERRGIRIGLCFLGALALVIAGWVLGGADFSHQSTSTLTWLVIAVAATAGISLIASGWRKKS